MFGVANCFRGLFCTSASKCYIIRSPLTYVTAPSTCTLATIVTFQWWQQSLLSSVLLQISYLHRTSYDPRYWPAGQTCWPDSPVLAPHLGLKVTQVQISMVKTNHYICFQYLCQTWPVGFFEAREVNSHGPCKLSAQIQMWCKWCCTLGVYYLLYFTVLCIWYVSYFILPWVYYMSSAVLSGVCSV